ncbi:unnamed protein product [Phytomonas sp. Hart1]|nr:unnamed protein product [Phytomonas sp. Hart1]|eukprot:CCW71835.1 unnamed protein product [Phytomonas sp. isolate Hart1]
MWRVSLSGVFFTSSDTRFLHTTHRWLWSCEQSLWKPISFDVFLEDLKRGAARDTQWLLDYFTIEELSRKMMRHELTPSTKLNPLVSIHNALCLTAKHNDLRDVHIILSSPQSLQLAVALVHEGSLCTKLESMEIHIHTSALSECDLNSEDMLGHESYKNSLGELFQALENSEGTHSPLRRLSIVMIDDATGPLASWNDAVVSALSSLLLHSHLSYIRLNYMNLQHCSESCLTKLVNALSNSSHTLRSLEIKAVPKLVKLVLEKEMLSQCRELQCLSLSHNRLGDRWNVQLVKDLNDSVGGWHQLHQLALTQCEVSSYFLEVLYKTLVSRKGERKTEVEDTTGPIARIKQFNLASNELTDDAIFHLSTCLMQCPFLTQLDLRHNSMSKSGVKQLLSSLTHAPLLRCLRLRSNRLTDEGIQSLSSYTQYWKELEELDLTRCRLTSRSLVDLATAIKSTPQLRVFRVSGNDFRPIKGSGTLLSKTRGDNTVSVGESELKLFAYGHSYMRPGDNAESGTRVHCDVRVPTSYEIDRRDRETRRVRYRDAQEIVQEMSDQSREALTNPFQVFGAALSSCQQLRVLDLSDCSLQDDGFASIASGLSLPQLEELHLSANPLFVKGGASLEGLIQALWSATETLRTLDLSFLGLGDLGISALCDGPLIEGDESKLGVLGELKKLEVLSLSHTNAGTLGIEAVRETVAELPQLRALFLDRNRCSGQDLVELLSSLCCLRQLRFVALTECVPNQKDHKQVILSKGFENLRELGVGIAI